MMRNLSFLAHSYVWEEPGGRDRLPTGLAVPWANLANRSGMPPVLTYHTYVLDNSRHSGLWGQDPFPLLTFSGTADENWFITVHQRIEDAGGPIVDASMRLPGVIKARDYQAVTEALGTVTQCLERMVAIARTMQAGCDPYIYYRRVRRYLHGWRGNVNFTGRSMKYEGVSVHLHPHGPLYYGETGAQSPLIPITDTMLGVTHSDPFRTFAKDMLSYMTPSQRTLVSASANSCVSEFALTGPPELRGAYRQSLELLQAFRTVHIEFARTYIADQERGARAQNRHVGTGGSAFLAALAAARRSVEELLHRTT
jgi:indoleamine 2,3-dioxygenase